jgi:beta-galactosidase
VAANAIDNDPVTFWHTRYGAKPAKPPHFLVIDMGREVTFAGISYLPRQDMGNGRISEAEIYTSQDPKSWGEPAAKAKFHLGNERQTVRFARPVTARYLKFVIPKAGLAAVAELDIIPDKHY